MTIHPRRAFFARLIVIALFIIVNALIIFVTLVFTCFNATNASMDALSVVFLHLLSLAENLVSSGQNRQLFDKKGGQNDC